MKFIYITCNVSMLETLTLLLDETECADYQVIEQVTSRSRWGEPRLNTPVWPGYNSSILVQEADPKKAEALIDGITKMNETAFNNSELVAAYMWGTDIYVDIKPVE